MVDLNLKISEYVNNFNSVINNHKFIETEYVSDLKNSVINCLKDNFHELDIISEDIKGTIFYFSYKNYIDINHAHVKYEIKLYFKVKAKRSNEMVEVSKTRKKYLNYIPNDPIEFLSCGLHFYYPSYSFTDDFKIKQRGIYLGSEELIKCKVDNTIQSIIDNIDVNDLIEQDKSNICNPIVIKAMFNKKYYDSIDFGRFVDKNGGIKDEEIYQFIIDNNMIKTDS